MPTDKHEGLKACLLALQRLEQSCGIRYPCCPVHESYIEHRVCGSTFQLHAFYYQRFDCTRLVPNSVFRTV